MLTERTRTFEQKLAQIDEEIRKVFTVKTINGKQLAALLKQREAMVQAYCKGE